MGKRYPTKEKKQFMKQFIAWEMYAGKPNRKKIIQFLFGSKLKKFQDRKVIASIRIDYQWFTNYKTKEGKMKVIDASNHLKLIEDCLAKYLSIDDCYFKHFNWTTRHCEKNEELQANIYRPSIL